MLGKKTSVEDILKYFSYFLQKTCFDISCKLSPGETICITYQRLFSEENKKRNIIIFVCLLNLPKEWKKVNFKPAQDISYNVEYSSLVSHLSYL